MSRQAGLLALALVCVFASATGILVRVIPGPHRSVDYLVIGAISTLACLLALFGLLLLTAPRRRELFFVRRRKEAK